MDQVPGDLEYGLRELCDETHDALRHYYDYAYLARHTLLSRFRPVFGSETTVGVRRLRRLLFETIENLRPASQVKETDSAWRPYNVLHHRYILGKELEELENELGLSARQIQREQRRAVVALAQIISKKLPQMNDEGDAPREETVLEREIYIVGQERDTVDAAELLKTAMELVKPLASQNGVALGSISAEQSIPLTGSSTILKNLLIGALSWIVKLESIDSVHSGLERADDRLIIILSAISTQPLSTRCTQLNVPQAIHMLAQSQQVQLTLTSNSLGWRLELAGPRMARTLTLVVVEDNPDIIALFARCLSTRGFRIVGITDSANALGRIVETMPDIIVLDILMSQIDGWELLRQIRTAPLLKDIPVIICSALEERDLASVLGADAYLTKPIRPAEILECLSALRHSHKLAEESW